MSAPLDPIPNDARVTEDDGTLSRRYFLWLYGLWSRVISNVTAVASVRQPNLTASLVNSTLFTTTQAGFYRVSYYIWLSTLATTSYSLTVTITWRNGGITKSQAFTALTGAPGTLATAFQSGSLAVAADSGTVIAISIAYVSVGVTPAVYNLLPAVELIS